MFELIIFIIIFMTKGWRDHCVNIQDHVDTLGKYNISNELYHFLTTKVTGKEVAIRFLRFVDDVCFVF